MTDPAAAEQLKAMLMDTLMGMVLGRPFRDPVTDYLDQRLGQDLTDIVDEED